METINEKIRILDRSKLEKHKLTETKNEQNNKYLTGTKIGKGCID